MCNEKPPSYPAAAHFVSPEATCYWHKSFQKYSMQMQIHTHVHTHTHILAHLLFKQFVFFLCRSQQG